MKKRTNTYRIVDKLPAKAVLVAEYADSKRIGEPAIYGQWRRHINNQSPIDFEIVIFKNMNFVIPKKQKEAKL